MAKLWIIIAALLGAGAVTLGAYHAHGLESELKKKYSLPDDNAKEQRTFTPIPSADARYHEKFDKNKDKDLDDDEAEAYVAKQMHNADVGVKYQMYSALAILAIGILAARRSSALLNVAAFAMLLGVVGFSGGLYSMVFDIANLHWAVVPIGGLLMIVGWVFLGFAGFTVAVDARNAATTAAKR